MYEDFRLSRSSRFTMIDKYIYMSISGISVGAFLELIRAWLRWQIDRSQTPVIFVQM